MTRRLTITYGQVGIAPQMVNVLFKFDDSEGEIEGCILKADWEWFRKYVLLDPIDMIREDDGKKIVIIDKEPECGNS